jgi:hypothetical protein
MIDLKLNEIPADPGETEEQRIARLTGKPSRGLSIDETIAHDADLSIGAGGVTTTNVGSGVSPDETRSDNPSVGTSLRSSDE